MCVLLQKTKGAVAVQGAVEGIVAVLRGAAVTRTRQWMVHRVTTRVRGAGRFVRPWCTPTLHGECGSCFAGELDGVRASGGTQRLARCLASRGDGWAGAVEVQYHSTNGIQLWYLRRPHAF